MPDDAKALPKYWLKVGDLPAGPFPAEVVHAKLAAGEVGWDTPACPLGGGTWVPLHATPGVGPTDPPPAAPAPPASAPSLDRPATGPTPAPAEERPDTPRAWNPAAIAALSVLFTPMWGGVVGAVNARRLGHAGRWWPPLAAGFGYLAFSYVPDAFVKYPPYWLELALYLGGVGALWTWGLAGQPAAFRDRVGPGAASTARWRLPAVLGVPLALIAAFKFLVVPLLPYEPREVCDRFAEASSAAECKRYATANLHPAIDAMYEQTQDDGKFSFELTDEAAAHPDAGGYLVGYRLLWTEKGKVERLEGVFHLVDFGRGWKVEDMLVTAAGGQQLDPPLSLARDYRRIFEPEIPPPSSRPKGGATAAAKPAGAAPDDGKSWMQRNRYLVMGAGAALTSIFGIGKASSRKSPPGEKS